MDRYERIEEENEELRDELDDIVNDIGEIIAGIAYGNGHIICGNCLRTAQSLFRLIEEHGDENAQINIMEQFRYITGKSLSDDDDIPERDSVMEMIDKALEAAGVPDSCDIIVSPDDTGSANEVRVHISSPEHGINETRIFDTVKGTFKNGFWPFKNT